MDSNPPLAVSIFDKAQKQSFQNADFKVAGRDMAIATVNVNFSTPSSSGDNWGAGDVSVTNPGVDFPRPSNRRTRDSGSRTLGNFKRRISEALLGKKNDGGRRTRQASDERYVPLQPLGVAPSLGNNSEAHTPSDSGPEDDDIGITSAEELDKRDTVCATKAEAYVRNMLAEGRGLPCSDPRPRIPLSQETGVVPGDVGTFNCEDGFKKIFNIWDDQESVREAYPASAAAYNPPVIGKALQESHLAAGQIMTQGVSSQVDMSKDSQDIDTYEFHCISQEGAILVSLSTADLEELTDPLLFQEFIIENREVICRYANGRRRLAERESLLIITGSIKNNSWAIAGYKEPMPSPYNILRLRRIFRTSAPSYIWTSQGTSDARVGNPSALALVNGQPKNQCLFLRGFKLAISPKVRARMNQSLAGGSNSNRGSPNSGSSSEPPGGNGDSSSHSNFGRSSGSGRSRGGSGEGASGAGGSGFLSTYSLNNDWAVEIEEYPTLHPTFRDPYDVLNEQLLAKNDVEFALTHDEDWRALLKGSAWNDASSSSLLMEIPGVYDVLIQDGVAFYLPKPLPQGGAIALPGIETPMMADSTTLAESSVNDLGGIEGLLGTASDGDSSAITATPTKPVPHLTFDGIHHTYNELSKRQATLFDDHLEAMHLQPQSTSPVMTPLFPLPQLFPNSPPPSDKDIAMFHSIFFPTT